MVTAQLTVGSASSVAIVVRSSFTVDRIIIRENHNVAGWPTTSWRLSSNADMSGATAFSSGEAKELIGYRGRFQPGTTVGYIETDAGTTTFDQVEEP